MILLFLGCSRTPPLGVGAELSLPLTWTRSPAGMSAQTTFTLDEAVAAGSALHLDAVYWRAAITLDGAALPPVTPGLAPLDVALPELGKGAHRLAVDVSMPGGEPVLLTLPNKTRAPQGGRWSLRLGNQAIRGLAVGLVGDEAVPTVTIASPPAGSTLETVVSRDGAVVERWGPAPADAPSARTGWSGAPWGVARPELYVVTAILRDTAGVELAERSERIGLRDASVADGRFVLGGKPMPIFAVRGLPSQSPAVAAALVAAGGLNAVEVHGAIASSAWFAPFDEWGLPIVQVARCDGGLWKGGDPAPVWSGLAAELGEQDTRLLDNSASRPAIVAWSCEGADSLRGLSCGRFHADPLHRPVLGVDITGITLSGTYAPPPRGPNWIIELGHPTTGTLPEASVVAHTFLSGMGAAGSGGVLPGPEGQESVESWGAAWRAAAASVGAPAWSPGSWRASSVVRVTGLAPGQSAVLRAPWIAPRGAFAGDDGVAVIEAWYAGEAAVTVAGASHPVTLVPDMWAGTSRVSHAVTLAL